MKAAMKASNNRVVIIAVALTVAATLYSLSELHRMSALHTAIDKRTSFSTRQEVASLGTTESRGEHIGVANACIFSAVCLVVEARSGVLNRSRSG